MNTFLSHICNLFRAVTRVGNGLPGPNLLSENVRLSVLTAVAGYDNKNTKYKTRISPKWVYGDDACFISESKTSFVLGVADGVGGWRSHGVDPGRFSRALMKNCERITSSRRFRSDKLELLISQCYEDVLNSKDPILGSATLCIISLQRNEHRVYGVSLGDSGFLVVRQGRIIQRSIHQKHTFNTPFQLASPPPLHSRHFHRDLPNQAVQSSIEVEPGDLIIVGTDGLFDNVPEPVILQQLNIVQPPSTHDIAQLHQCAQRLVDLARNAVFTPDFISPFATEARRYGINIAGGVPADITVILGLIVEDCYVQGPSARNAVSREAQIYSVNTSQHKCRDTWSCPELINCPQLSNSVPTTSNCQPNSSTYSNSTIYMN